MEEENHTSTTSFAFLSNQITKAHKMAQIANLEELGIALRAYQRAALLFRGAEKWDEAGDAFATLAQGCYSFDI